MISVTISFGSSVFSRSDADEGIWNRSATAIERSPSGPATVTRAPSEISAGARLEALTKYAGPLLPRMAW